MTTGSTGAFLRRMRTLWMVVVVLLVGCAKRVPQVFIPNTPEGNTCKRECMNVRASCDSSGSRRDRKEVCPKRELDCLITCPGAVAEGNREESLSPMKVEPVASSPAPEATPTPTSPPRCVASELPEWQGADAATKKKLMEQCRAPANP